MWNIWIDVKLLPDIIFSHCLIFSKLPAFWLHVFCGCCFTSFPYLQQGGRGDLQSSAQRSSLQESQEARTDHPCVPARLWSPVVQVCFHFHLSFNFISFRCRHGHRLSPEPARRFISCLFITALWSQFVMVGTIWLSWTEVSASNSLHLALVTAMVLFDTFSGLFTDPFLSGILGVFFARKMHSTSEFAKIVLSKCVCVWEYTSRQNCMYVV